MLIESNERDLMTTTDREVVIHFPDGIPAFGDGQSFSLVENEELAPFVMLKSVDVEDFGFFCICPFKLDPNYVIELNEEKQKKLKISDPDDVTALAIVTRTDRPEDFTANLLAPLVINVKNRLAKQVISEKSPVRTNVLDALRKIRRQQTRED